MADGVLARLELGSGVVGAWEEYGRLMYHRLLVAMERVPLRMVFT